LPINAEPRQGRTLADLDSDILGGENRKDVLVGDVITDKNNGTCTNPDPQVRNDGSLVDIAEDTLNDHLALYDPSTFFDGDLPGSIRSLTLVEHVSIVKRRTDDLRLDPSSGMLVRKLSQTFFQPSNRH
jgi:hypothetical protein